MKRRDFITLLGGATAAGPLSVLAQQPSVPVIGYLSFGSPESDTVRLAGLRCGLNESGYVEDRNVAIEFRWARNQYDRLPALAVDLVQHRVAVIVTPGMFSTLAAKAAAQNVPIAFSVGLDPVQLGLVVSLSRPEGNLTGFNEMGSELGPKSIEVLHELLPTTTTAASAPSVAATTAEIERTTDQDWAGGGSIRSSARDPERA